MPTFSPDVVVVDVPENVSVATPIPGFVANECPDDVGTLVGSRGRPGQLQWSYYSPFIIIDNDFTSVEVNPGGDSASQTWGYEKVVTTNAHTGNQSWRLSHGIIDAGTRTLPSVNCMCVQQSRERAWR